MAKTGSRFLLDTNIIIALLEGDACVLLNLDRVPEVFVPAIALGEPFFGAAKSGRPFENTARVERFGSDRSFGPKAHRYPGTTSGLPRPPGIMNWLW